MYGKYIPQKTVEADKCIKISPAKFKSSPEYIQVPRIAEENPGKCVTIHFAMGDYLGPVQRYIGRIKP